ncbi:MAG: hypothetical protein ACTSWC_04875 [Promethearchaeota archaeon]
MEYIAEDINILPHRFFLTSKKYVELMMSSNTIDLSKSARKMRIEKIFEPKDPRMMFKLQFILFIALERLISYFSFIYSII